MARTMVVSMGTNGGGPCREDGEVLSVLAGSLVRSYVVIQVRVPDPLIETTKAPEGAFVYCNKYQCYLPSSAPISEANALRHSA